MEQKLNKDSAWRRRAGFAPDTVPLVTLEERKDD